jgi:predicted nuclease of predicted toxin-antitoxin system
MECITIQDLNWCGVKDKELSLRIKGSNYILVTRDKDFTFIWRQRKLKVVYITVEPAVLTNIEPRIREMFENWEYSVIQPFLLVIQNDSMRLWE